MTKRARIVPIFLVIVPLPVPQLAYCTLKLLVHSGGG
ncbi:unnamed protein product, partial [marine sediment metagenome]